MLVRELTLLDDRIYSIRDDDRGYVSISHAKDVPRLTVRKHEFAFSLTYPLAGVMGTHHAYGQSAYLTRDQEVHIYPIHQGTEMEVILHRRPKSNRFVFQVRQTLGLNFDKQPGACLARPENIVDSFAIYCDKRNNEYGTGKIGHIFRAEARDSTGHSVWCDMEYRGSQLTVIVPWEFLNDATLPIVVDPTLGYTTVGGTADGGVFNALIVANGYQIPETGTATAWRFYTDTGANFTGGVYNGSSSAASSLLVATTGGNPGGSNPSFRSKAITGALVSGNYYYIAATKDGANSYYDLASPSARRGFDSRTYVDGVMPNPYDVGATYDNAANHSQYIDYSVGVTLKRSQFLTMFPV